jgi:hypothetical protein
VRVFRYRNTWERRKGYILVALFNEFGPIPDSSRHGAAVDVVKWRAVVPVLFDIVEFKVDVWWDPSSDISLTCKNIP